MRSKKIRYVIAAIIFVIIAVGGYMTYQVIEQKNNLAASKKQVTRFVKALTDQKFSNLSSVLSESSVKTAGYTNKSVQEKYEAIYSGIGVSKVTVKNQKVTKKTTNTYNFQYMLTFSTDIGELKNVKYEGTLKKTGDTYKINWQPNLIFPGMEGQDKVAITTDYATRGEILDRNNQGLAVNQELNQLGVIPSKLGTGDQKTQAIQTIASQFDLTTDAIQTALDQSWVTDDTFVPLTILYDDVPSTLPTGASIQQVAGRYYPLSEAAAQLIGYVGDVTAEDIEKDSSLVVGESIGRSGLEATYDEQLRGTDGGSLTITDENGNEKSVLLKKDKKDGETITLTIDANAQKIAYESLGGQKGASVVTMPTTGDLLALVSSPSFNPNKMANGITSEEYQAYVDSGNTPFVSRYTTRYAPGSTFKSITGAIGIDAGTLDPSEELAISGLQWQKDSSWGSYKVTRVKETNPVNLYDGLIYSDNIYFAQQTLKMGETKFREGLSKFIFGEELDLPLSMEPAQISNEDSFATEVLLADTGYGQGQLLISPIQQETMYSVFANAGTLVYPKLLLNAETKTKANVVSSNAVNIIGPDLRAYVTDPNAFGYSLNSLGIDVAAKTGTAEVKQSQDDTTGSENSFLFTYDYANHNYLTLTMVEGSTGDWTAIKHVDSLLTYLNNTYQ